MRDEEDRQGMGLTHPAVAGTKRMQVREFRHILQCAQGRVWFLSGLSPQQRNAGGASVSSASVVGSAKGLYVYLGLSGETGTRSFIDWIRSSNRCAKGLTARLCTILRVSSGVTT